MPIFEYHCEHCNCHFEHLQLADNDPVPQCPSCCGTQITKMMSAGSFRPNGTPAGKGGFKAAPSCRPSGG
jgi:putative FmdB family regulatory protein